jgi:hypothetical protein
MVARRRDYRLIGWRCGRRLELDGSALRSFFLACDVLYTSVT